VEGDPEEVAEAGNVDSVDDVNIDLAAGPEPAVALVSESELHRQCCALAPVYA
jgi:hypothetical protein